MVSRRLTTVWSLLALALLAAAGITIAFSVIYRMPNVIENFVFQPSFTLGGLVLGVMYAVTVVLSIGGIVQPNHVTLGLTILNWILLGDGIATLAVGSLIWFYTLTERADYDTKFLAASTSVRQTLQDHFHCCGYFFNNDTSVLNAGFCQDPTFAKNQTACVGPVTGFADYTLNNVFTSIYGFMSIIILFMLATMCVINKRIEAERFRKIDAKRGGRGFV